MQAGLSGQSPYRVVVVDDSPLYRLRFARLFGRRSRLTVVGVAADGQEAIRLITSVRPDVVLLDLTMPHPDGFDVLRWIMAHVPTPVVVCSSRGDRESIFKALELGAVDYIVKPGSREPISQLEAILVERVEAAAEAHLMRERASATPEPTIHRPERPARIAAIAASTGGPAAIQRLVLTLPRELEIPIVIVQHMPPGFTRLFAERLARQSHYDAEEAVEGAFPRSGTIAVAPGGMQTTIVDRGDGPVFQVRSRDQGDHYAPSADRLFASIAELYGAYAAAVVLTGMGDDGSRGAVTVKAFGGWVLAESVESALIYGMPRAAVESGCVDAQLPIDRISSALAVLAGG